MPIRKEDYPTDWKTLSLKVREEAGQRCEWCDAPNGRVIKRGLGQAFVLVTQVKAYKEGPWEETEGMSWRRLRFHRLTRVVLSVAHLDRNSKNDARENLAALCQRCHLRYDIWQHIANRRFGRYHAKEHQYKLPLET